MAPKTRSGNSEKRDFIALLPKEIALSVFGYLEPSDLLKAAQTSRVWRKQVEDDLLWKNKCEEASLAYRLNSQNEETLKRLSKTYSFNYSVWKASFLKPYRIEKNFQTKRPEVAKVQKCHFIEPDYLFLSMLDNLIFSSSSNALYVSCTLTGKTLHILAGHNGPVRATQANTDFIISAGGLDKIVRVWDINIGVCLHVLRGHTSPVICLKLHDGIVVSGSEDTTLRLWDVRVGQLLGTLTGHTGGVTCVEYNGNMVVSGSDDGMVKVWDPVRGECRRTLAVQGRICSLKVDGDLLVAGSFNTVKIWEWETGCLKNILHNYQGEVQGNLLVNFNRLERRYKIRNILANSSLTLDSDVDATTRMQFNKKFVVTSTGQFDGKVKLWDVKTGEFIRDLLLMESSGKVVKILLQDAKIVCALQMLRLDNVKKVEIFVLNFDMM